MHRDGMHAMGGHAARRRGEWRIGVAAEDAVVHAISDANAVQIQGIESDMPSGSTSTPGPNMGACLSRTARTTDRQPAGGQRSP